MLPASTREIRDYVPTEFSAEERARLEKARDEAETPEAKALFDERLKQFDAPPTYRIGVASAWGKQVIRRATIAAGVRPVDHIEILDCLAEAVKAVVADHQQQELLDLLDRARAIQDGKVKDKLTENESRNLQQLDVVARQHYPPYAELMALSAAWFPTMQYIAAKHMLRGWENVRDSDGKPIRFRLSNGLVSDECLNLIPERHLEEIGLQAILLMALTEQQKKSSASPSPSPSTAKTSTAGPTPPTDPAGNSSASDTTATPDS